MRTRYVQPGCRPGSLPILEVRLFIAGHARCAMNNGAQQEPRLGRLKLDVNTEAEK